MPNNQNKKKEKNWYLRAVLKVFFVFLLIIASTFLLAGRITYWQGWGFGAVIVLVILVQSIVFAHKTELAKERQKPGPGTKWWDKVISAFLASMFLAILVIASLDAGRFGWTKQLPMFVYIISYIVFVFSIAITAWAKWVNKWFSSVVRIQKDRDQKVVQIGPYKIVRHPGYVGGILMGLTMPLVLGSLWALIPAGITVILLIIRTYLEDTTLQKELPGYTDYAKKVRHRLLPGIW